MELIEKIRAEIERLKGIGGIVPLDNREQKTGYESALMDIETFLSTLESEKPNQDELEKEIKQYYDDWDGDCRYAQTAREELPGRYIQAQTRLLEHQH